MFPTLVNCAKAHWKSAPSATHTFKRAQKGLFGGKVKRFGNNVPESHHKTRRTWLPNIQNKTLYSATLDRLIKIKVTTSVLRDIDNSGGLDGYLLKRTSQPHLGKTGSELREEILATRALKQVETA